MAFTLTATTSSSGVLNTLYLQNVLGFTPTLTGALLMITSLAVIAGSALGSPFSKQLGFRWMMALGLLGIAAVQGLYTLASAPFGLVYVGAGLALAGLGLGCASVASTAAALAEVTPERQGVASGLVNTAAQLGTALGIVVFVAIASARTELLETVMSERSALLRGSHWAFIAAALMTLTTAALVVFPRLEQQRS